MMQAQEPEARTPLHEVITFYSYKGGTGRTMALANVACLFARQIGSGRVLAVDWDLEAPGLHYYLRSPSGEAADPNVEGVVEYFTRIQEIVGSVPADPDGEEKAAESALDQLPLDRFRRSTCVSNIDLMPAGRLDESYSSRLAKLDWQLIYEKSPALFRTFARRLAKEYDVVLVDSRTGMTDISGICTALLPDKLVVVFTANQQSLTGVERLVRNSVEYRQGSRDLRPLLVYPLPSRIDAERDKLRQLWRFGNVERRIEGFQPQFERIFCSAYAMESSDLTNYCNEVQVQHSPDYSYGEEVAALDAADADRFSIVRSYEALVQWLSSSAAPWESPQKARQRQRLESVLVDEAGMLESGAPPDVRRLMALQEEVVRLALEQRPQHLDTVAAVERLVETCLKRANDVGRAIEVLETLTVDLSSMRLPVKLKAVDVLLNGARLLNAQGRAEEAQRLSRVALEGVAASQAVLDEAGLDAVERVAVGLQRGGAFGEARTLLELVRDRRSQLKDADDPSVLNSMNNLAGTLRRQGDLAGARALQEQVLAVRRRVLGEEHPDTLTSMNSLAGTLLAQGDLAGARALEERTLAGRRRVLGDEHPDTLIAMSNLANTLQGQGDLAGARALQAQTLVVRRRVLGDEHSHTLTSMNNLAETLRAQGDLAGARALQEQVLAVRRRVLGEEHPDTLTSTNNLAATLRAQGDLAGARALQEHLLLIIRRVLGEDHPYTLTSMSNLAGTLRAQGDLAGARTLQEQVLAGSRRVLGEEHPHTLTSMNNLAETLRAQGDLPGATGADAVSPPADAGRGAPGHVGGDEQPREHVAGTRRPGRRAGT